MDQVNMKKLDIKVLFLVLYFSIGVSAVLPPYNAAVGTTRDDLVTHYFNCDYTNQEILQSLLGIHAISMSLSTLKRILKRLNIRRRRPESPLVDILGAIFEELKGSGKSLGYRMMVKRLRLQYGLSIRRDTVMKLLRTLDPDGVQRRRGNRLIRRSYIVPGPNFIWHVDGYDKLKPFGFSIHGCVDGFSRRILWLEVGPSNKCSTVIANYYLDCVAQLKIVPRILRCDLGTENALLEALQPFFRRDSPDSLRGLNSFIYGRSTANQRIESWWSKLRQLLSGFWINFFKDLRDNNEFNDSNPIHTNCLRFCFMRLIRAELYRTAIEWNVHRIRVKKNGEYVGGKPDILFFTPQQVGKVNYGVPVAPHELQACKQICEIDQSSATVGCSEAFTELVRCIVPGNQLPAPTTATEALQLYRDLLRDISAYDQDQD